MRLIKWNLCTRYIGYDTKEIEDKGLSNYVQSQHMKKSQKAKVHQLSLYLKDPDKVRIKLVE
jgi:hypothetical protein